MPIVPAERVQAHICATPRCRRPGTGHFWPVWGGVPVGAGIFTAPADGITELAGITTLPEFRRRGVATALTSVALRHAFDTGVEIATLSAADSRAGRVYKRVGFRPHAAVLHYLDGDSSAAVDT